MKVAFLILLGLFLVIPTPAQADQYLVTGTLIDPGMMMPPEKFMEVWMTVISPSLSMLDQWVKDGTISGGVYVGKKKGVFIADVKSNAELDQMLQSLPFWPMLDWEVYPLHGFGERHQQEMQRMEMMKKQVKK